MSHMKMVIRNLSLGFQTRSDTNQAVQPQKMARGSNFQISEVDGSYYLFSKNRGADQLCGKKLFGVSNQPVLLHRLARVLRF